MFDCSLYFFFFFLEEICIFLFFCVCSKKRQWLQCVTVCTEAVISEPFGLTYPSSAWCIFETRFYSPFQSLLTWPDCCLLPGASRRERSESWSAVVCPNAWDIDHNFVSTSALSVCPQKEICMRFIICCKPHTLVSGSVSSGFYFKAEFFL